VLDTGRRESLGAGLVIPTDVMDLVGITLLLEDALTIVVIDVDLMFVVKIDSANPAIRVDSDGFDSTSTLSDLNSLLLLTSLGIPGEDGRLAAILARDSSSTVGANTGAQNIISMVFHVISDVLSSAINLTATKEFLGVVLVVKNDTKGSSHVDGLSTGVEVDVLLGVSASVTIDVLEIVGDARGILVDGVMVIRLDDLTFPRKYRHELFTLGFFYFEEIVFATTVVFAFIAFANGTGLLIDTDTSIIVHLGVISKSAWSRSFGGGSTAHFSVRFCFSKKIIINFF